MYRSNVCFVSKLVFTSLFMILGKSNWQQSQEFIDNEGEHNTDVVSKIFPIVKYAMIAMTVGRLVLMLISYKNLKVCQSYIYYQAAYMILEMCLPRNYGDMQLNMLMVNNVFNFLLLYTNFWPNCIVMLSTQMFQVASNSLVYDKEFNQQVIMQCVISLFYQFLNYFLIHIGTNLVGLLYVEAELLRQGNSQLLNEMGEGVIVMD